MVLRVREYFLKNDKIMLIFVSVLFMVGLFVFQNSADVILSRDEYGYWANAALMCGDNWAASLTDVPYYSYGYSLFLVPIYFLFHSWPILMYKFSVGLNVVFCVLHVIVLYRIGRKIYADMPAPLLMGISVVAVATIGNLTQINYTSPECLLALLFSLLVEQMICLERNFKYKNLLFLTILSVCIYITHQRCLGILCSSYLIAIVILIRKHKLGRQALLCLGMGLLILLLQSFVKQGFTSSFWGGSATVNVNDYSGQTGKIQAILFSLDGFKAFIKSVLGKLYGIGIVSFGLVYFGILSSLKQGLRGFLRKRGEETNNNFCATYLFLALSFVTTWGIASVFLYAANRLDQLVYSRYLEFLVPVLVLIGIASIFRAKKRHILFAFLGIAVFLLAFGGLVDTRWSLQYPVSQAPSIRNAMVYVFTSRGYSCVWISGIILAILALVVFVCKRTKGTAENFLIYGVCVGVSMLAGGTVNLAMQKRLVPIQGIIDAVENMKTTVSNIVLYSEGEDPGLEKIQLQFQYPDIIFEVYEEGVSVEDKVLLTSQASKVTAELTRNSLKRKFSGEAYGYIPAQYIESIPLQFSDDIIASVVLGQESDSANPQVEEALSLSHGENCIYTCIDVEEAQSEELGYYEVVNAQTEETVLTEKILASNIDENAQIPIYINVNCPQTDKYRLRIYLDQTMAGSVHDILYTGIMDKCEVLKTDKAEMEALSALLQTLDLEIPLYYVIDSEQAGLEVDISYLSEVLSNWSCETISYDELLAARDQNQRYLLVRNDLELLWPILEDYRIIGKLSDYTILVGDYKQSLEKIDQKSVEMFSDGEEISISYFSLMPNRTFSSGTNFLIPEGFYLLSVRYEANLSLIGEERKLEIHNDTGIVEGAFRDTDRVDQLLFLSSGIESSIIEMISSFKIWKDFSVSVSRTEENAKIFAILKSCYSVMLDRQYGGSGILDIYSRVIDESPGLEAVIGIFLGSPEFLLKDISQEGVVDILYRLLLGRGAEMQEIVEGANLLAESDGLQKLVYELSGRGDFKEEFSWYMNR